VGYGFFVFTVFHVKNGEFFGEKSAKIGVLGPWVGVPGPLGRAPGGPGGGVPGGGPRDPGPGGVPDLCRVNRALTG